MIERRDARLHSVRALQWLLYRKRKQRGAPITIQRVTVAEVEKALGIVRDGPLVRRARIRRRRTAALLIDVLAEPGHDEVVEALQAVEPAHSGRGLLEQLTRPLRLP